MRKLRSFLLRACCWIGMFLTLAALLSVVLYIFRGGLAHITWDVLFGAYRADAPTLSFAWVTTLYMVALSLLIAAPIGVGCAIYLTEYARRESWLVAGIRLATETLAGIPSIVFGLFGALCFGTALHMGYSILCGVCTLSIMILPTLIRTAEESIRSVPDLYREGSYGLGAGKLRTITQIVLPSAARGILSAIVLSTGRIVGETAALIFTLGSVAQMPGSLWDSSRTLAVDMYISTRDGGMAGRNHAFAAGVVLIVVVTLINVITLHLSGRAGKKDEN